VIERVDPSIEHLDPDLDRVIPHGSNLFDGGKLATNGSLLRSDHFDLLVRGHYSTPSLDARLLRQGEAHASL
jgi:hypothetical protein